MRAILCFLCPLLLNALLIVGSILLLPPLGWTFLVALSIVNLGFLCTAFWRTEPADTGHGHSDKILMGLSNIDNVHEMDRIVAQAAAAPRH